MFNKNDLHLLNSHLQTLEKATYFSKGISEYVSSLLITVQYAIDQYANIHPDIIKQFSNSVWIATRYLNGSATNETPYEAVYSLNLALDEWIQGNTVICTALLDDKSYHFQAADPAGFIKQIDPKFDLNLIQIALPQLYKNLPLYNVPLYHELGHFVDISKKVSEASILLDPVDNSKFDPNSLLSHRREYFADLFAACYVGKSMAVMLNNLAEDEPASFTHPATNDRLSLIDDLLTGTQNDLIDLFNKTLNQIGLPNLKVRYTCPDIDTNFSSIRPIELNTDGELHGIYEASWVYITNAQENKPDPWSILPDEDINRIINDLVEKSIRNTMIVRKWQ